VTTFVSVSRQNQLLFFVFLFQSLLNANAIWFSFSSKKKNWRFLRGKRQDIFFTIYARKTQRYNTHEAERIPENNPRRVFILGGGRGGKRPREREGCDEDDNDDDDGLEYSTKKK